MSEFDFERNTVEYLAWAENVIKDEPEVITSEKTENMLSFESEYAVGSVSVSHFSTFHVAELQIISKKDGTNYFYLHFEFNDLMHAEELFDEMMESFRGLKDKQKIRVLLCCSSGITTSYFKEKLNEATSVLGFDVEFNAVDYTKLFDKGFDSDVILLAPQIAHLENRVREILNDKPVRLIPTAVFASYNVTEMLGLVRQMVEEQERQKKSRMIPLERMEFTHSPMLLVIAVICEYGQKRIIYRIYERGNVIYNGEVIKEIYRLRDLRDILDVVVPMFPQIRMVTVCTPGVVCDGYLTYKGSGIYHEEVTMSFSEMYERPFIFMNDANAMALGFYGMQTDYQDITFYFHPHHAPFAGIGNVIDGKVHEGHCSLSGETQYIYRGNSYTEDPADLIRTPDGSLKALRTYLLSVISMVAPEVIAIYCDMVPDMKELKACIAEVVQAEYIPELIKVYSITEYMFCGGLMKCIEYLNEKK